MNSPAITERWDEFDQDQDQRWSRAEYDRFSYTQDWRDLDANQDNYISRSEAEMDTDLMENWSELDTDENDMLDEEEFARFDMETED